MHPTTLHPYAFVLKLHKILDTLKVQTLTKLTRPYDFRTTKGPTQKPTPLPTTHAPTLRPTRPNFDELDLYVLLDSSRSMRWHAQVCGQIPGGAKSPSAQKVKGFSLFCATLYTRNPTDVCGGFVRNIRI